MTWVRYDDNVANHPKVAPLDDATYRLWREAIEWCAHNLTDGVVLARQLNLTSSRASKARAARLVKGDLWHPAGGECPSKQCPPSGQDGWVIHDYWEYQPTRERAREVQLAAAERTRKWRDAKRKPKGDPPGDANGDASRDGERMPSPPRPAPPHPYGVGGDVVPDALPAAVGGVAAAGGGARSNPRDDIQCPTCGNAMGSAYHRGACTRSTKGAA